MIRRTDYQQSDIDLEVPLISIIVPVYQVKDYIDECLESLLRQTHTKLEIILVDDGSTDGSGEVCDRYANRETRVQVLHQDNQGLSAARNAGLEFAKGEYVAFVDSDDVVLPDFIETLYELLDEYRADIAACAYVKCSTKKMGYIKKRLLRASTEEYEHASIGGFSKWCEKLKKRQELCMTSEETLRRWHGKYKKWETVVWNKLYRRSIFEGGKEGILRFPVGRLHEDILSSHLFIANAERVVITRRTLYLYRNRTGSITNRSMTERLRNENLQAQRERMVFFKKRRYRWACRNLLVGYMLHVGWFWCKKR